MDTVLELFGRSASTIRFDDSFSRSAPELAGDGRRVAAWLADAGLQRGDRVAIRLPNGADYLRLLLGCAAGGFVAVSVNNRYSDAEAADLVRRSGAHELERVLTETATKPPAAQASSRRR